MELQINKWYHYDNWLLCYRGIKNVTLRAYGFSNDRVWSNEASFGNSPSLWKRATDKEVKEALINEAKKRGLVGGTEVETAYYKDNKVCNAGYYFSDGFLYDSGGNSTLFRSGKWATVVDTKNTQVEVPKEPIQTNSFKIGDRVRFLGTDFDGDYGTIKDIDLGESYVYFDDDTKEWYSNNRLELVLEEKIIENMDNHLDELNKAYEMEERLKSTSKVDERVTKSSSINYDNEFPRKKVKKYVNQDPTLNVLVSKRKGY